MSQTGHADIPRLEGAALVVAINDRLRRLSDRIVQNAGTTIGGVVTGSGTIALAVPGTLAVQSNAAPLVVLDVDRKANRIRVAVKEAAEGASIIVEILVADEVWTTLTVEDGDTQAETDAQGLPAIRAGDLVTVDIAGVGTTFPGADLTVLIYLA